MLCKVGVQTVEMSRGERLQRNVAQYRDDLGLGVDAVGRPGGRPDGPTGVYVIDSKRYRGHLRSTGGHLWHGGRTLDRTLETLWWEATQVAETLGFGPDLHIYPVLCVHVARLPWLGELLVDGVPVLDAGALRPALQVTRQALTPEQVALVAGQVRAGFRPAA
jgi:hypothetical protein